MRAVSRATWTSGEPVSLVPRALSAITFWVSMDIDVFSWMRGRQARAGAHRLAGRLRKAARGPGTDGFCLGKKARELYPPGSGADKARNPARRRGGGHGSGNDRVPEQALRRQPAALLH